MSFSHTVVVNRVIEKIVWAGVGLVFTLQDAKIRMMVLEHLLSENLSHPFKMKLLP